MTEIKIVVPWETSSRTGQGSNVTLDYSLSLLIIPSNHISISSRARRALSFSRCRSLVLRNPNSMSVRLVCLSLDGLFSFSCAFVATNWQRQESTSGSGYPGYLGRLITGHLGTSWIKVLSLMQAPPSAHILNSLHLLQERHQALLVRDRVHPCSLEDQRD